jgi:TonB family protein
MRSRLMWGALVAVAMFAGRPVELRAVQRADVKTPRKIKDVKPVYPEQSLAAGDEGVVIVELKVDPSGSVADARVLRSKCPALNEPALKAARGWRFEKLLLNGEPTPFTITTHVPFRLPDRLKSRANRPGACRWEDPLKLKPIF